MKSTLFFLLCFAFPIDKDGKYDDDINAFRQHYKEEFLTDKNSPLKAADTSFLRFYAPDEKYKVTADVTLTKDAQPFKIQTHSKKEKDYKEYAVLKFKLKGKSLVLHTYQNVGWEKIPTQKDIMFIPFTDETNNKETYGGGRYIDLDAKDIKDGKIVLDFNKSYNPYCAFAEGYSCPIPPRENSLDIGIKAGEKLFGKEIK
jgi:uncharacterized protein (DUF1684 family)